MKQPIFNYNPETGITTCTIEDNEHNLYIGTATCHEQDRDMMNEKVGCEIALAKAAMKFYKGLIKRTRHELAGLNQLFFSINKSGRYNHDAYESIMLRKLIEHKEDDINAYKEVIGSLKYDLAVYTGTKEALYKKLRLLRREKELEKMHEEGLI